MSTIFWTISLPEWQLRSKQQTVTQVGLTTITPQWAEMNHYQNMWLSCITRQLTILIGILLCLLYHTPSRLVIFTGCHMFSWIHKAQLVTAINDACFQQLNLTIIENHVRLITNWPVDITNCNISQRTIDLSPWPAKFHITIHALNLPSNLFCRLLPWRADSNYPIITSTRLPVLTTIIRNHVSWRKL